MTWSEIQALKRLETIMRPPGEEAAGPSTEPDLLAEWGLLADPSLGLPRMQLRFDRHLDRSLPGVWGGRRRLFAR